MQRRTALKYLFIVGGSTLVLSACNNEKGETSIKLKNLKVSGEDEKLLTLFADTIIPKTGTPGAVDVGAHLFTLKMMDDCFTKEDQQGFEKGLKELEGFTKKQSGKTFMESSPDERIAVLTDVMKDDAEKSDLKTFAGLAKQLVLKGYTQSKYFMTEVQPYVMIPGHFYGCVDVKNKKTA